VGGRWGGGGYQSQEERGRGGGEEERDVMKIDPSRPTHPHQYRTKPHICSAVLVINRQVHGSRVLVPNDGGLREEDHSSSGREGKRQHTEGGITVAALSGSRHVLRVFIGTRCPAPPHSIHTKAMTSVASRAFLLVVKVRNVDATRPVHWEPAVLRGSTSAHTGGRTDHRTTVDRGVLSAHNTHRRQSQITITEGLLFR
jgi:hypothetical protein